MSKTEHAMWGPSFNAWPWATKKKSTETVPESKFIHEQKSALRSLEQIQASRPLKPPGVVR